MFGKNLGKLLNFTSKLNIIYIENELDHSIFIKGGTIHDLHAAVTLSQNLLTFQPSISW